MDNSVLGAYKVGILVYGFIFVFLFSCLKSRKENVFQLFFALRHLRKKHKFEVNCITNLQLKGRGSVGFPRTRRIADGLQTCTLLGLDH